MSFNLVETRMLLSRRGWFYFGLSLLAIVSACSVVAQEIVPASDAAGTPPANAVTASDETADQAPLPTTNDDVMHAALRGSDNTIMSAPRRFQFMLGLTVRGVYDDNINLAPTHAAGDFYFAFEPMLAAGFGDLISRQENYLRLDYIPSVFIFAEHSSENTVQHVARLEGQYRFSRLTVTASQTIQILDGANLPSTTPNGSLSTGVNLDVSGRRRENDFLTHVAASYDLSGKTFLSGAIDASMNDYSSLINSEYISGNAFINYNYSPKVVLGLGGTAGYNWVEDQNPNQQFEQVNFRASYQATGKLSLNGSVGVEFRQFENAGTSQHISPVYSLGASYQPFDGTTITLNGSRQTQNSAVLSGQDYVMSDITVSVRQRLLQRVFLGITGGYENTSYFGTLPGVNASRQDNYYFIEPTIDVIVTRWLSAGIYYFHRRDNSSLATYGFNDNQIGLRASLSF